MAWFYSARWPEIGPPYTQERFDGIWACASLLHVLPSAFPDVASRLANALRPGGAWYLSFKLGVGVRTVAGRLFVDHTAESLRTALSNLPLRMVETWTSEDARPGRGGEHWLNAVVLKRQPNRGRCTWACFGPV